MIGKKLFLRSVHSIVLMKCTALVAVPLCMATLTCNVSGEGSANISLIFPCTKGSNYKWDLIKAAFLSHLTNVASEDSVGIYECFGLNWKTVCG